MLLAVLVSLPRKQAVDVDFNYHHYDDLERVLINISQEYPDIARLYSIGRSIEGKPQQ